MATQFFGHGQRLRRGDLLLIRKAIAKGWGVPAETKVAIMRDVMAVISDETAGARLFCAAARTVLAMEADNHLKDKHDQELRHCAETCRRWLDDNPEPESKRKPKRPR